MTKYYITLIFFVLSISTISSLGNFKVFALEQPPLAVSSLFISEISFDAHDLDYNQRCGPSDNKASCSFDKWFEIYNPNPETSVKLSDIFFSVNNGKNLNSIVSTDIIKPQSYAVVHNSRVANGAIDTFKLSNKITTGKSGWVGSISGQNSGTYNIHLGIYYKDNTGNGVLINSRNLSGLAFQKIDAPRKTIYFNSVKNDFTYATNSFLKIGTLEFYGNPGSGLIKVQTPTEKPTEIKQPAISKAENPANALQQKQISKQYATNTSINKVSANVQATKTALEPALNLELSKKLKTIEKIQLNLNIEKPQILSTDFKPATKVNLTFSENNSSSKLAPSTVLNSYSHSEIILLDCLFLTLVGLKLITRSKVLKLKFDTLTN